MIRVIIAILLAASLAEAANQTCPGGTLAAGDTVTARTATALAFQGVQLTSSPTVTIQICCVGTCDAAGNWAPVTGGAMALSAGTPTLAISVIYPTCMYRASTSGGTATVGFACSGP
jgi:hypothetical protein